MTSLDDLRQQAGELLATCQAINAKIETAARARPRPRRGRSSQQTEPRLARH